MGGVQLSIHPLYSSSKSLPLPANENEVIVTYLSRWLCLLRREDTKLSSFEEDAHQGNTVVGFTCYFLSTELAVKAMKKKMSLCK